MAIQVYRTETEVFHGTDEDGVQYENFADAIVVCEGESCEIHATVYSALGGTARMDMVTHSWGSAQNLVRDFFSLFRITTPIWEELHTSQ